MNIIFGCITILALVILVLFALIVRLVAHVFLGIAVSAPREESPDNIAGEDVFFASSDGLKLHGFFVPGKNTSGRTIVFCHEVGAGWGSWYKYAHFLPEAGFNVFSFDSRGYGASEKQDHYKTNQWITNYDIYDLEGAITSLNNRPEVDMKRLGLFGISRGGGTAICTAAKIGNFKAIATDSIFSTYETLIDYIHRWASVYFPVKNISPIANKFLTTVSLIYIQFKLRHKLPRVEKYLNKIASVPLFFIHGEQDNHISIDQAKRLYRMAKDPKKFWAVKKARHNEAVLVEPEEYSKNLISFFNDYL